MNPEHSSDPEKRHDPVVRALGVTKVFRDFWRRPKVKAVDHLDLEVARGEIVGLLGPNGSGKSTTLKILLGLLHADEGRIEVLGEPPVAVRPKRHIGYLPEESNLYRYLNGRETLDFFGRLFGLPGRERTRRTGELLEMVGLAGAADRAVGEYSKGMLRRLGLAQALINDPEFIVLDEPTSGLDPLGCRQVKDLMLALARRGKTILMSSHLLADVEDVCGRIMVMHRGRVRAQGSVHDLLRRSDRIRFTVRADGVASAEEMSRWIQQKTGTPPEMDCPSMDLEQFFLTVVREADEGVAIPDRPGDGPRVAPFLEGR